MSYLSDPPGKGSVYITRRTIGTLLKDSRIATAALNNKAFSDDVVMPAGQNDVLQNVIQRTRGSLGHAGQSNRNGSAAVKPASAISAVLA